MKAIHIFIFLFVGLIGVSANANHFLNRSIRSTVTVENGNDIASGFFIAPNLIVTSNTITQKRMTIQTHHTNRQFRDGKVIARDHRLNLAIVMVSGANERSLELTNSKPYFNDRVFILCATERGIGTSEERIKDMRLIEGHQLLKTTAKANTTFNGAPAFNRNRKVVGVSMMKIRRGKVVSFIVPAKYLRRLMHQSYQSYINAEGNVPTVWWAGRLADTDRSLQMDYYEKCNNESEFYFTYNNKRSAVSKSISGRAFKLIDKTTGEEVFPFAINGGSVHQNIIIPAGKEVRFSLKYPPLSPYTSTINMYGEFNKGKAFCFSVVDLNRLVFAKHFKTWKYSNYNAIASSG